MKSLYILFGFAACLLLGFANFKGYALVDFLSTNRWGPQGAGTYHK